MHNFIIIAIIVVILLLQIRQFRLIRKTTNSLKNIFPTSAYNSFRLVKDNKDGLGSFNVIEDLSGSVDETRSNIICSINNYLESNGANASDFYLIKDIADRNCETITDKLQTLTPTPLYLGLMGTMCGILVGVGSLVTSGTLNSLLEAGSGYGADGLEALLSGVALAMICSIAGLLLTTSATISAQAARASCDRSKDNFLSWVQTTLLPQMTSNAGAALHIMTTQLSSFNDSFSKNAEKLNNALSVISQTSLQQMQILETIDRLNVKKIATANIDIYDKLKSCVDELNSFSDAAHECRLFAEQMTSAGQKLAETDARVGMVVKMAEFFDRWEKELKTITSSTNRQIDDAYLSMIKNNKSLTEFTDSALDELKNIFETQTVKFKDLTETISLHMETAIRDFQNSNAKRIEKLDQTMQTENEAIKARAEQLSQMADNIGKVAGLSEALAATNDKLSGICDVLNSIADDSRSRDKTTAKLLDSIEKQNDALRKLQKSKDSGVKERQNDIRNNTEAQNESNISGASSNKRHNGILRRFFNRLMSRQK